MPTPGASADGGPREAAKTQAASLARSGRFDAAAGLLERWLSHNSQDPELWLLAGDMWQRAGNLESAVKAWEQASTGPVELRTTAFLRIGGLRLQMADANGAHESFAQASLSMPGSADAHCGLAAAAGQLGDFTAVKREAAAAVALDRHCYTAWYQLTLAPGGEADLVPEMQNAAKSAGADPQAWLLYVALGRALERCERYDAAFAAYEEGQRRRRRVFAIDYVRQRRYFESVRRHLGRSFVQRRLAGNATGGRPIFIVGMPRSGTTLVEAVLGAHPRVAAGGEMRFVYEWLRRNAGAAATEATPAWLARAGDDRLAELARAWRELLDATRGSRECVTDKFPLNYTQVGLLNACFPEASIVHVRRDPRDTCISCYTTALYGDAVPATLRDLGDCYRQYLALMDHWRDVLGADRIIEIQYEELATNPEPVVRRLLDAVGLEWHQDCLAFHESRRPVATASLYQVRQPIYSTSIGRWRRFEPHLGPLLAELNQLPAGP